MNDKKYVINLKAEHQNELQFRSANFDEISICM